MKSSFAKRLKEIMDIKSIKQSEIVEKTGIPKSAISQYLSGKFEAKQDRVYLLAKLFDVSEAWLMGYDVPMESQNNAEPNSTGKQEKSNVSDELSEREESLITNYRQLNTEGKDKTDEYVEDLIKTGKYSDDDDENVEIVTIAARKGGGTITLKKRGNKSIFDAPDYR